MKKKKTIYQTAKNASKLHRRILELLSSEDSMFKNYNIRQEVSVKDINPTFSTRREKIDIIINDLRVCIEVHGRQHYTKVCFGGIDGQEAERKFKEQQDRDYKKQKAVEEAGWAYIAIPYTDKNIDLGELTRRIKEALDAVEEYIEVEKPKQKIKSQGFRSKPEGYKYKWPQRKIQTKKQ